MSRELFDYSREEIATEYENAFWQHTMSMYKQDEIESWTGQRFEDIPKGGDHAFELQVRHMRRLCQLKFWCTGSDLCQNLGA